MKSRRHNAKIFSCEERVSAELNQITKETNISNYKTSVHAKLCTQGSCLLKLSCQEANKAKQQSQQLRFTAE
jgi:hypothetical protein